MTSPDEPTPDGEGTEPIRDDSAGSERTTLTTDDEAQTDDPVIDPANS